MIANISPSIFSLDDTLNTLKYANRAKNIKTNYKRNVLDVDYHINRYDEDISTLKKELENLRHQLAVKTHNVYLTNQEAQQNPLSKVDRANKEIAKHFGEEIKVKREIIEEDKKIENLLVNYKEAEYELFKYLNSGENRKSGMKNKLRNDLKKINENIESCKASLVKKKELQSQLISKREEIEKIIAKTSNEPLGKSLNLTYQYYIVMLDNLSIENNKNMNMNSLRQKEVKLNKLIDQVKFRDEFISNATNLLNKKGVKINSVQQIKPLSELQIQHSFILPVVLNSQKNIINYSSKTKNIKPPTRTASGFGSRSGSPYQSYSNPNIVKEKKKFKSKTTEIIDKAKKKSLTEMKLNMINDLYPSSKVYHFNSNNFNRKITGSKLTNIIPLNAISLNSSYDKGNTSINSYSKASDNSSSRKKREIDKKVKNILLKKNLVGRNRNSPYLKNFNNYL